MPEMMHNLRSINKNFDERDNRDHYLNPFTASHDYYTLCLENKGLADWGLRMEVAYVTIFLQSTCAQPSLNRIAS